MRGSYDIELPKRGGGTRLGIKGSCWFCGSGMFKIVGRIQKPKALFETKHPPHTHKFVPLKFELGKARLTIACACGRVKNISADYEYIRRDKERNK